MRAKDVNTTTTNRRSSRRGSRGFGMPAMNEPMTIRNMPAMTALIVPEMLKPAISSSLVMGVTR